MEIEQEGNREDIIKLPCAVVSAFPPVSFLVCQRALSITQVLTKMVSCGV